MTLRLSACLLVFWWLCAGYLPAQDLHFSQFFAAPLSQDPAMAGAFDGDLRMGGLLRDQWRSVPVPYRTFSAYFDQKYYRPWVGAGELGWGMVFQHDKAGDSQLSWAMLGLRGAYRRSLSDSWKLAAGLGVDLGQRAFDPVLLQFADQYNGEFFDPSQTSLEAFDRTASGFISLSTGLNAFYQARDSRARLWAGLSAFHLNSPKIQFFDGAGVARPMLFKAYAFGDWPVADNLDVSGWLQGQTQGAYRELALGAGVRRHLRPDADVPLSVMLGLGYRWADALLAYAELRYDRWRLGFSYDVNTSGFRSATAGRGGPEVSVQYFIFRVHPPDEFKSCPIF